MDTATASGHVGMGSIPCSGETAFRVWAPFANRVYVEGDFNGWSKTDTPLAWEGNGYWSADVPGAHTGQRYKYVLCLNGLELERNDPYAKDVTGVSEDPAECASIIFDSGFDWGVEPFQMSSWNELVIYEMHIGTFHDPSGPVPGNFQSAIDRLGYLQKLGVNAIQVMPPMEFGGRFSQGYNPAHIFAIEENYGGPNAFKQFVKAAHSCGIAVIFDVVYNHMGPNCLDMWQFDGWHENNLGGIYFYNNEYAETPWGHTRPDYGRHEVRQYIRDNALMWLEEYRIDGLRWDATAHIDKLEKHEGDKKYWKDIPGGWGWHLMKWVNNEINFRHPWKISIAEDLRNNEWVTKGTSEGGGGFDSQWDAGFVYPLRDALIGAFDHDRNMYAVRDAICHSYNRGAFNRVIYLESHDEVDMENRKYRISKAICPGDPYSWWSRKRSALGMILLLTSPGIPMLFQGQEFLEEEGFADECPLDWSNYGAYNGFLQMCRDLIHLRRNWYDHSRGLRGHGITVHHVNNDDKIIAFERYEHGGPRDSVIVVANFADRQYDSYNIGFPREGLWKVRFNSDWQGYDPGFGNHPGYDTAAWPGARDSMPCNGNVGIGPYSVLVLSQDE
ncbi:MAG: alpha-amylase family glycosyl hydrolase [Planctomycetota bacterium]|jgi:1,4-alpha-glucan branching enzyme